jgi:hypothetical protein
VVEVERLDRKRKSSFSAKTWHLWRNEQQVLVWGREVNNEYGIGAIEKP